MKCLSVLTENSKNIDYELVQMYLSQLNSLKTILMSNLVEKSLQQSYLAILNHILHHTILVPKVNKIYCQTFKYKTFKGIIILFGLGS